MTDERRHHAGLFIGIVITVIGVIFLLDQLEIVHASWVFQVFWPVILIALGMSIIFRTSSFRGNTVPNRNDTLNPEQPNATCFPENLSGARTTTINFWGPVLILIGVLWLLSNITHFDAGRLWPLWLIAVGAWLLVNKNRPRRVRRRDWNRYGQPPHGWPPSSGPAPGPGAGPGVGSGPSPTSSGFADQRGGYENWAVAPGSAPPNPTPGMPNAGAESSTTPPPGTSASAANASASVDDAFEHSIIFMAFKRRITTQHFRYAKLSAVFGGFNLDFSMADMEGSQAIIHIEAVFGGGEIRVPPSWRVSIDAHAFAGAFMDETYGQPPVTAPTKTLIVRGSTVFGGVVIKN